MRLILFVVADYANQTNGHDSSLNIIGVPCCVTATKFPAHHFKLFLVHQFLVEDSPEEATSHLRWTYIEPNGEELEIWDHWRTLPAVEGIQFVNFVFGLMDFTCSTRGIYWFRLYIDDVLEASYPIEARLIG